MLSTEVATRPEPVLITSGKITLIGQLAFPPQAHSVVILLNGKYPIAEPFALRLNEANLATLTVDLLTPDEAQTDSRTGHYSNDSDLQSRRIRDILLWAGEHAMTFDLPIAIAATGPAARGVLRAASADPGAIQALVLDGVRASDVPPGLKIPVLLLMTDDPVDMRRAQTVAEALSGPAKLRLLPSATAHAVSPFFSDAAGQIAAPWLSETLQRDRGHNLE